MREKNAYDLNEVGLERRRCRYCGGYKRKKNVSPYDASEGGVILINRCRCR